MYKYPVISIQSRIRIGNSSYSLHDGMVYAVWLVGKMILYGSKQRQSLTLESRMNRDWKGEIFFPNREIVSMHHTVKVYGGVCAF